MFSHLGRKDLGRQLCEGEKIKLQCIVRRIVIAMAMAVSL